MSKETFLHVMTMPNNFNIAVSGGADSMCALDFFRRGGKNLTVLHLNHGTEHADDAQKLVEDYCFRHGIRIVIGKITGQREKSQSREEFWRVQRYKFFMNACNGKPVVICHHLDDVIETWLFSSLHGNPMLIPESRSVYLRPFLETRASAMRSWCERKDVPFIDDPSNEDTTFMRNYIRHVLMPNALHVNPGLSKVIRKKLIKQRAENTFRGNDD